MRAKRDIEERFWSHVDKSGDCWVWTGAKSSWGYGVFQLGRGLGVARSHRWIYEQLNGPVGNLLVCHKCDTPACVNPSHMFLGSQGDNLRDMAAKGRSANQLKTECPQGHPYDAANTRIEPSTGRRRCRICEGVRSRNQYLRRKENGNTSGLPTRW